MKRPSIQFYTGDWLAALELRAVSLAARGLWIEMICLMKQGHEVGFLTYADGRPVTVEQLARMVGDTTARVKALLSELEDAGVPGKAENGAYFSRRMVRDEAHYREYKAGQAEAGKRGAAVRWAEPHSESKARNGVAHSDPIEVPKGKDASSSSSSTSTSSRDQERPSLTPLADGLSACLSTRKQMNRQHGHCHPEICNWRDSKVRQCMPLALVDTYARKLTALPIAAAVANVIAWARADAPPADYVASGDTYAHWRLRWDLTKASAPAARSVAREEPSRVVPGAKATDALLDEMIGGRVPLIGG
jgi:hypothetical protein